MKKKLPDNKLLADLERVNDKVGRVATATEYREHGKRSDTALVERFGSWEDAQAEVGNKIDHRQATDDELLDNVAKVNEELGRPATAREYIKRGDWSYVTVQKRFGGWKNVQAKLGHDITDRPGVEG